MQWDKISVYIYNVSICSSLDIVDSAPKAFLLPHFEKKKIMQELLKRHGVNKNGQIFIHILTVKQNESCFSNTKLPCRRLSRNVRATVMTAPIMSQNHD